MSLKDSLLKESKNVVQNYMVGLMIEMGIVALIKRLGFVIIWTEYPYSWPYFPQF